MDKLAKLYSEIRPKVYAFFYVKTGNPALAEDLTQDTFYEAVKGYKKFQGKSSLQTWVFAIAKNILKKYYRKSKSQVKLLKQVQQELQPGQSIEDDYLVKLDFQQLLKEIDQLDQLEREIVLLRISGELSFREIGQLTNRTENYVRVHFHRAKLKLRREMRDSHE